MKRQNIALLLVLLLLFTNMIPLSEAYKEDLGEKTTEELDKKQSALKEDKKVPLEITRILLDEDAVVEKELVEIDKDWIDLAEYIDKDQAFKSLENELKKEVEYVGRRSQNGELLEEVEEIELEILEKKEGQFILILEYKVKEETLLEEEKELRHLLVKEEEKDYQVILPKEAGEQNASSPALLASTNSKKVTVTPIDPRGSWAFFHVWDTKKPPITGITSTFAYFKLADGSIGFCMDPGLAAPQGDLPVDVFSNSEFRHFAEKVATLAISSGGITGYSFEENYVFAQMYIWKNIPLAGESKNRYVLDFRYQHSPFEQHKETMAKYLAWKNEIDRKMNHLGKISFDGNSLELELGKEYRLEDKNKNLHAFNIKTNNADLYVRKEANTLILKAEKPLNTRLEFWQARNSYPLPEVTYLLKGHDASYQDLGVFRDPFVATLRVSSKQTVARAKIIKRDKDKNSIRGAVFQVSSSRDFKQILEEITSNNDGIALSKEYSINQYPKLYIREKSVPEPYIKSEEIKEIILDSAKTVETTYINDTKKVRLYKKDFFTGKAISGAVIELTDPSGNKKEYRTDQEGKVEIIGIKSGAYSFKEKASPKGYTLNKKSFTFSVTSKGQISGTTELTNEPTRLRLLKKDKNTGQPLAGAGFEVYAMEEKEGRRQIQATYDKDQGRYLLAEKGESIFFSSDRGEVLIDHLPQGDYLVVEVQASPGYKLGSSGSPVEKPFRIDKDGQLSLKEIEFFNPPTEVVLLKKDRLTDKPVAGAKIEITRDDQLIKSLVSDEKGQVKVLGLTTGTYDYREIEAPSGYVLEDKTYSFTIDGAGNTRGTREFTNEPTRLRLLKKDKNTGQPLAGAGFEVFAMEEKEGRRQIQAIYDKDQGRYLLAEKGESIFFSNDRGEVLIDHLPQGDYLVVEVQASPGYKLGSSGRPVEKTLRIDKNGQLSPKEVEFFNPPTEVVLQKKDRLTGKPVAAAKIEITRKGQLIKSLVSDEKGQVKVLGLTSGTYDYRETEAPSGYVLEDKTYSFTIDGAGNTRGTREFTNEPTRLRLLKKDKNTGQPLAGAGFEVFAMEEKEGRRQIQATYDKDQGRYLLAEKGESIFFSNDRGEVLIDHLPQGDYLVREVQASPGYKLGSSGRPVEKTLRIDKNGQLSPKEVEFFNPPTEVVLQKKDRLTGKPVAAAKIEITRDDQLIKSLVSDEKGQVKVLGLTSGTYDYREIEAPSGYVLEDKTYSFTIDGAGNTRGTTEFTNEPTRLRLLKKDKNTGQPLAGAGFEVFAMEEKEGRRQIQATYDKDQGRYLLAEKGESIFFSNDRGEVLIDHLPQGDYLVEETKALAGYRLPQDISKRSKIILIDNDSKQGAPASVFLNEPTQVILTKKDMLTGIALSGAEIEVSINDKKSKFTSDEKGQIELIGLKPGSYSFKETKQPLGYILSKEEFIFFIDQKGHARGVSEFINEPTRLIVKKTDEKNKAMKGVVFELRNSEGKIIKANYDKKSGRYLVAEKGENKNFISNKQGTISIDYLPEGDYILKETRSLRGYIPCEEQKINFENYGVNSPLLIELVNKRELPKTGEKSSHGLVFLSIVLAAAGFLIQKRFN